jgi:hypothetical protein
MVIAVASAKANSRIRSSCDRPIADNECSGIRFQSTCFDWGARDGGNLLSETAMNVCLFGVVSRRRIQEHRTKVSFGLRRRAASLSPPCCDNLQRRE